MDDYLLSNNQNIGYNSKPNTLHIDHKLHHARQSYLKSEVASPLPNQSKPFMLTDHPDLNSARGVC
jgi:hypothetical protein